MEGPGSVAVVLGGSFGIAMVSTLLARRAQVHQALMVSHLTPFDPAYTEQLASLQSALTPTLGQAGADLTGQAVLYGQLLEQARLWAFVENFRIYGLLCLASLPLIFLFKRVRGRPSQAAMH